MPGIIVNMSKITVLVLLVACAGRGPNEIPRNMVRPVLAHGEEFTNDPRIPMWCADPKSRRQIEERCRQNDMRERAMAKQAMKDELRAAKERVANEESEKNRADVLKRAASEGYAVDFDTGLTMTIVHVRRGEKKLKDLSKTAISLVGDSGFVAVQVVDQDNVLFRNASSDAIVWLKDYKRAGGDVTWLEGAELTSMEWGYVAIRGTKEYRTAFGSKQAVIIEPVF